MGGIEKIANLKAELLKTIEKMDKTFIYYKEFRKDFPQHSSNSKKYDLVLLADIITDYYTCLETGFVRISKYFENNLDQDRWHKHLLEKMILEIPGIRNAVLEEKTYYLLDEFLRFRHFKRYYYGYNYDKDRMEYLEKKFLQSIPMVKKDIQEFLLFLEELGSQH